MNDPAIQRSVRCGWILLAVSIPFGLTLELLQGMREPLYLQSELRRELWRLAHAHGNLLGILCLVYGAIGERWIPRARTRLTISRLLCLGAVAMPLGFFSGGILNFEGDPSPGIALVPIGGLALLGAVLLAAIQGGASVDGREG